MQFGSLAVLARLIPPEAFGGFGMVVVIVRFAGLVGNLGLIQAVIHRDPLDESDLNSLFWFSTGINVLIGSILYAGGPLVAGFYREPGLLWPLRLLCISVLLQNLGNMSRACLERRFSFLPVMWSEMASMGLGIAVAIHLALQGWGLLALVAQDLVHMISKNLLFLATSPWKPGWSFSRARLTPFLRYSAGLTGSNLVHFFSRNLDNVMIGKRFGAAELGFYQKAYALLLLPLRQLNAPLTRALLPALSRKRSTPAAYRDVYRRSYACLCALGMPLTMGIAVTSREVILLLLGPDWITAHVFFVALLPGAFASVTNMGTGWVFTSWGHTHLQFVWSLIQAGTIVAGILIASLFSALAVAWTFSICFAILRIPAVIFCFRPTPLRPMDFWAPTLRSLAVCGLAGALALWIPEALLFSTPPALPLALLVKAGTFAIALPAFDLLIPGTKILSLGLQMFHHLFAHD